MHNDESSPVVTQCTFSGNTADSGGGVCNQDDGSPTVTNCILWNDTPEAIYNDDPDSTPVVTYSDVQGGYAGTGNIDDAPLFVDAPGGDLRLGGGSPCIDSGDNAAVPPGLTTDLDGHPRISHGTVDMGAYERQDDDGDGVLNDEDDCPDTAAGDAVDTDGCSTEDDDGDGVLNDADDCPDTPSCATVDADGCTSDTDADGVVDGCDDCPNTPSCATNIDAHGCAIDSDGDGSPDGCPPAAQGCCGATGPVAPLGLAVGLLFLSRFAGYRNMRRRR